MFSLFSGLKFIAQTEKQVSNVTEYTLHSELFTICFSLSVFQNIWFASFNHLPFLYKTSSQKAYFEEFYVTTNVIDSVCVVRGDCYYSVRSSKEIKVWNPTTGCSSTIRKFDQKLLALLCFAYRSRCVHLFINNWLHAGNGDSGASKFRTRCVRVLV